MKNKPLISVMMPAYNAEKTLRPAIESIINQTYTNWELIFYNDGSIDRTLSIAEELAKTDPRIKVISGERGGRGKARNAIVPHCQGKYVAVCDADDISVPERFEKQALFLENNPEISAVGAFQIPFSALNERPKEPIIAWPVTPEEIAQKFQDLRMGIPNCSAMIRTECFTKYGAFQEQLLRAQDFGFFLKLHGQGCRFFNIPEPLVYYWQENSIPSFHYWSESEKFHSLAIKISGIPEAKISKKGKARIILLEKLQLIRYIYFYTKLLIRNKKS